MPFYVLRALFLLGTSLLLCTALRASDLLSISSFTNIEKNQSIYALGIYGQACNDATAPEVALYKNFLYNLSASSVPTTCVLFLPKEEVFALQNSVSPVTNLNGLLCQTAARNNFQSGTIRYTILNYACAEELSNFKRYPLSYLKPEILKKFIPQFGSSWLPSVIEFMQNQYQGVDPFFQENNRFSALENAIIRLSQSTKEPPITNYLAIMKAYDSICAKLPDHPLTSYLTKQWPAVVEQARCYIKVHNLRGEVPKLSEILLSAIRKNKAFLAGFEEFKRMVLSPLSLIQKIEQNGLLIKLLPSSKKLLFCFSYFSKELIDPFRAMGFKERIIGTFIENGELAGFSKNTFSPQEIQTLLASIVNDTFSTRAIHHAPNESLFYYDSDSQKNAPKPVKDHTKQTCDSCTRSLESCAAFAMRGTTCYCSLPCLIAELFKEESTTLQLSYLLNESTVLSKDEKEVLKHYGALCYLRAALLKPSVGKEYGIVYQLPLKSIISSLEKLERCPDAQRTDSWKAVLALCKTWKISIESLTISFRVYLALKQKYLQGLLEKRFMTTAYEDLDSTPLNIFDEKDTCLSSQKAAFNALKKGFGFSDTTATSSILLLYQKLIDLIHQKVGLPFDRIDDLLCIDYALSTVEELMTHMNYEENPLVDEQESAPIPRKSASKAQIQHPHQEEDLDEKKEPCPLKAVTPCQPSLLPSFLEADTPFNRISSHTQKIGTIKASFAGHTPYVISLFKARNALPQELKEAHQIWKSCTGIKESQRIKVLFALAHDAQENQRPVYCNSYGCPTIEYRGCHASVQEKLDLDHLFTRTVDTFLQTHGIAERIRDLIQISIPGTLAYGKNKNVGFFQYSFTQEWVCIHRCFRPYNASLFDPYVSTALRTALYNFLIKECLDNEYKDTISHLETMLPSTMTSQEEKLSLG